MKRLTIATVLTLFLLPGLHAQTSPSTPTSPVTPIAGTIWKGTLYAPDPIECLLRFKKDTLQMIYAGESSITSWDGRYVTVHDSAVLEAMTYSQHGDTLQLQKVDGGSPCDNKQVGIFLIEMPNGKLHLAVIKDPCEARPYAFTEQLTRVR